MDMKKLIIILAVGLVGGIGALALLNGGKDAAEDRDAMYARAKVFQDSIANIIKTSMDAAATPVPGGQVVAVNPTAQSTPSGQATQTTTK